MLDSIWALKSSVCGFVKRHKTAVAVVGGVTACAGIGYYSVKKLMREADNIGNELQRQFLKQQKLSMEMEKSSKECEEAVLRFLPSLRSVLYELIDVDSIVNSLKTLEKDQREDKIRLWNELKIAVLTRYFSGLYAFSLLHLIVNIQLHIIGRHTFNKEKDITDEESSAHHQLLSTSIEYLLHDGVEKITKHVKCQLIESPEVVSWEVHRKTAVAEQDLSSFLHDLHKTLAIREGDADSVALWKSFIIRGEDSVAKDRSSSIEELYNECYDILDSPSFEDALCESTNCVTHLALEHTKGSIYTVVDTSDSQEMKDVPALPLAKILPQIKTALGRVLASSGGSKAKLSQSFTSSLSQLSAVQDLNYQVFLQDSQGGLPFC